MENWYNGSNIVVKTTRAESPLPCEGPRSRATAIMVAPLAAGTFVPNLRRDNFAVFDGKPQQDTGRS